MIIAIISLCDSSNKSKIRNLFKDFYEEGLELFNKGPIEDKENAIKLFKKSIDADSSFAPSYALLAISKAQLTGDFNYLAPETAWPDAIAAANKAVILD